MVMINVEPTINPVIKNIEPKLEVDHTMLTKSYGNCFEKGACELVKMWAYLLMYPILPF